MTGKKEKIGAFKKHNHEQMEIIQIFSVTHRT